MTDTLRSCIVTEQGYTFVCIDASQIELRVMAILSQDPKLLEDLETEDLHLATAVRMYGFTDDEVDMEQRRYDAKQGNFALVYGADEFKLSEMLECEIEEAKQFMEEHRRTYPVLYEWIDTIKKQAKEDGYVTNMFGRVRPIPELSSSSWKERAKGERMAVNTIVQGAAVDIIKLMMLYLRRALPPEVRLVLQVHDEILFEVPDELVTSTLEEVKELSPAFPNYPVKVEVGKVYGDLKEIK